MHGKEEYFLIGPKCTVKVPREDGLAAVRAVYPDAIAEGSVNHWTYFVGGTELCNVVAEAWTKQFDAWHLRIALPETLAATQSLHAEAQQLNVFPEALRAARWFTHHVCGGQLKGYEYGTPETGEYAWQQKAYFIARKSTRYIMTVPESTGRIYCRMLAQALHAHCQGHQWNGARPLDGSAYRSFGAGYNANRHVLLGAATLAQLPDAATRLPAEHTIYINPGSVRLEYAALTVSTPPDSIEIYGPEAIAL